MIKNLNRKPIKITKLGEKNGDCLTKKADFKNLFI